MKHSISPFFVVSLMLATALFAADGDLPRGPDDRGADTGEPKLIGPDFTPNRFSGIPRDTIQIVAWYDGSTKVSPTIHIEYRNQETAELEWFEVRSLPRSSHRDQGTQVLTEEYAVPGCLLTGKFKITGAEPDGVIDGVAFGILWKDEFGAYHRLQSNSYEPETSASYIGMWPVEMSPSHFYAMAPWLTTGHARNQAMSLLWGARLLPNGTYEIPVH